MSAREVEDLTRELVSIPSHEDETAAGDRIESWLRAETDAEVTRDDAGNVIARRGGGAGEVDRPARRSLALVGHHDVVPPAASQTTDDGGYVVEERDGRLYGRGTADMKGSVAAAMLAFRDSEVHRTSGSRTQSDDADLAGSECELVFASFVGEEIGGVGARAAIDEGFAPDHAVVAEGSTNYSKPGVTDVVVAHKGRRGSTVTARGAAAHASEPESGDNAIYRACDAVDLIRDLEFPAVKVFGERLRGSVAATEIDGGSAWNVIPETCEVTVDERTVPGERAALERVEEIAGVEWAVDQDLPPMRCDDEAFAETVLAAARDAHAERAAGADPDAESASGSPMPELVTKPHATDAGWLAQAGTTCVVCGASEPGEAHTKDESVSLDVLERCYEIYRGTAERFVQD
ncbi:MULTISPECIES: M20 family metallopeptidase [Halorussus]|uniref:M20 family metallopeptidase n=1 Tax=Halorussus TaxID=1070314 RepID=UPI0020A0934A|nr:M20/M25/M40 family metallo-hydrolase [Halorussus vallis]USZ74802.1 M20/M25/M40 family metallo-hydrolase [Halorussus vallis]